MRLDKFLAETTGLTRSQAAKVLRQSAVTVNGKIEKSGAVKVSPDDEIYYDGERLTWVENGNTLCCTNRKVTFAPMKMAIIRPFINFLIIRYLPVCTVPGGWMWIPQVWCC